MTEQQKTLVQSSFEKVVPISAQAAELFYGRLFEIAPEVRSLFKGDMKVQGTKLMQMIGYAVSSLDNLDVLVPAVQQLGKRHKGYEVKPEHYAMVGQALLWTLEQGLGKDFTPETKEAWTVVYSVLSNVMQAA